MPLKDTDAPASPEECGVDVEGKVLETKSFNKPLKSRKRTEAVQSGVVETRGNRNTDLKYRLSGCQVNSVVNPVYVSREISKD